MKPVYRQHPGSNFSLIISCPDKRLSWFYSGKCEHSPFHLTLLYTTRATGTTLLNSLRISRLVTATFLSDFRNTNIGNDENRTRQFFRAHTLVLDMKIEGQQDQSKTMLGPEGIDMMTKA
ncbi:hypothetical protein L798_09650 [Zootermopsis nevadensis]|uniref:Uncharacterized protein n=1 Tax=Zootermopsis nevadensis TaxID=136037 RepID=A0A067RC08_ZOONE|nr:hypothetical protein L798_09650 [Zootermopsis nevadensis]